MGTGISLGKKRPQLSLGWDWDRLFRESLVARLTSHYSILISKLLEIAECNALYDFNDSETLQSIIHENKPYND